MFFCCLHVVSVLLLILFLWVAQEVIKIMSGVHDEHLLFLMCVSKIDW